MDPKVLTDYLLSLPGSKKTSRLGKGLSVYEVSERMFAILETKTPLRLSLRCDPKLASLLRDKYDEVMPGHKLNKTHWNTIVLSGQLSLEEIKDLIYLSYQLVRGED